MPADLKEQLHRAYSAPPPAPSTATAVWNRGRRQRSRQRVTVAVGVAAAVLAAFAGLLPLARPSGVAINDDPAATVPADADGWDVLAPGTFDFDQIDAEIDGWETILRLGATATASFDVAPNGTVAVFVPTTETISVHTPGRTVQQIDATLPPGSFDPELSPHQLRIGPDGHYYLTSAAEGKEGFDLEGVENRLTVFAPTGELVGTKVTPVSHEPLVFDEGLVWLRTDDGWAAVATLGGDLTVGASRIFSPDVPELTRIDDQGSILNQITGGPMVGTRYTLRQEGRELAWTGPLDLLGWATGPAHEDQPPVVLVQHNDRPPLVLAPSLGGMLAAWADPNAEGLVGAGRSSAQVVDTPQGPQMYWLEPEQGELTLVRGAPS